jgi:CelD/BcsL family acetyltransferase involved in cellulose biosynthesis
MERQVRLYDFLPGEFSYKQNWCPEVRHVLDLEAFGPFNVRAGLFRLMRHVKRIAKRKSAPSAASADPQTHET